MALEKNEPGHSGADDHEPFAGVEEFVRTYKDHALPFSFIEDLFNTLPVMILILNDLREAVFGNRRLMEYLEISESEYRDHVIGRKPGAILDCIYPHESDEDCGATRFCKVCGANRVILSCLDGNRKCGECRLLRRGACEIEAVDLDVWGHPFSYECRDYILFCLVDISDVKRRRMLERLFFHDLMNVIQGLSGTIYLMTNFKDHRREQDFDHLKDYVDQIIEEILAHRDLTAAESNELTVTNQKIDIRDLISSVIDAYLKNELSEERMIYTDMQSENYVLETDPVLLRRVLGNLIKNGLEAVRPGESVTVRYGESARDFEIRVHTPTVMNERARLEIFKRSFSTKGADRGIGLYSVKLLTERYLKGTVDFTSTEEAGTTFRLRFHKNGEYQESLSEMNLPARSRVRQGH